MIEMNKDFKFLKWNGKSAVVLLSLTVALAILLVGGSLAFILTETGVLANIFRPARVDVVINNNTIVNDSEIPVYVRAAVVVTCVKDGVVLSNPTYVINALDGWVEDTETGYWYYTKKLDVGSQIDFIDSITVSSPLDGADLYAEILTSVIQAIPDDAVEQSWGVTVNGDGTLTVN